AAARAARDAANSAATHADRAADAAEWAVLYAGQALEYANKSTEFANEATKAADAATAAVLKAVEVEEAARKAEWQRLDEDTQRAMEDVRLLGQIEARERAEIERKRTQAEQTVQATKDVIAQAETALKAGDTTRATDLGRRAALALMDSHGAWSQEAARFALAGTDAEIHAWIDVDRRIAQRQDDRESVLFLARIAQPSVALAAAKALESTDPEAPAKFLAGGAAQAAVADNRVAVARLLGENPGRAVKAAANAALDSGTPEALYEFMTVTFEAAQREDDGVATAALLGSGGRYTRAHAQVAMEGPAWMRRNFIASVQYKSAQLDYDSDTHIAAMQGAIAAAAKIADKAQVDAARAQQAAALARAASQEAQVWADKATASAKQAEASALKADSFADQAERSAVSARASAAKAAQAASVARVAARSANYSASRAVESARNAVASANAALASANSARSSALQAGQNRDAAAAAASEARSVAVEKAWTERTAAAKQAAEEAQANKAAGINPCNKEDYDNFEDEVRPGSAKAYAASFHEAGMIVGFIGVGAGAVGIGLSFTPAAPAAPFFMAAGMGIGIAAGLLDTTSAVFYGVGYGWKSDEFRKQASIAALSVVTLGMSGGIKAAAHLGTKGAHALHEASQVIHEAVSPIVSWLSSKDGH
ncbi:hypothetical protein ACWCPG_37195, partial [Streptomyces sp. NPDC001919]